MALRAVAEVERVFTAAESRALDRLAIDTLRIPGIVLMKRAGRAVFDAVRQRWPLAKRLTVVCGSGNNAGDGYVVAGLARSRGVEVELLQLGDPARLTGDAGLARDWAIAEGVAIAVVSNDSPQFSITGDIVIDALLGTGLAGPVRPAYAGAMALMMESGRPVVAVDVPSGLCSDTGHPQGSAIAADLTVTFIGVKRGLVTGAGPKLAGRLLFDDLGVPAELAGRAGGNPTLRWRALHRDLPVRSRTAHKHDAGHVVVLGGDHGMGGAVALAAEAALRVGAGLVSVVTRSAHLPAILARRPEIMVRGADDADADVLGLLRRASVVAVGPGLGRADWGQRLLEAARSSGRPLVMDADALNVCVQRGWPFTAAVITPHPGEAARLLQIDSAAVQRDRFAAVRGLALASGGSAVLKGAGSLVDDGSEVSVCLHGNAAMATAGMGDVLTGVIAGLLAQGLNPQTAARLGVTLHSAAGDVAAARRGGRGLLAGDVVDAIEVLLATPPHDAP